MREFVNNCLDGKEFKRIRMKCNCTQDNIASFLNVSTKTIERWESSDKNVPGSTARLMKMLDDDPSLLNDYEIPKRTTNLRIKYMFHHDLCTIIDVDEMNRKVTIKNFTQCYLFCAFGVVQNPTYEQYEEFLESRCFPRTRDKMKIMLKALEIPFYDPMLIIEKTKGRMAEDDFWLDIERDE